MGTNPVEPLFGLSVWMPDCFGWQSAASVGAAIRRMLMATAERRRADDILVDAVIVWESLFGAPQEATLRVTSSLALLLGGSAQDHRDRQKAYKRVSHCRSQVVHGKQPKPDTVYQHSQEAVETSIQALRAIFTTHSSLLMAKDSEERSLRILVAGEKGFGGN